MCNFQEDIIFERSFGVIQKLCNAGGEVSAGVIVELLQNALI